MLGQTAGGATTAVFQGFIILVLSVFIGLDFKHCRVPPRPRVHGTIGVAFTAFGIAIASRMDDMTGFELIMNFVVFPIFGLSGALFPISSLPSWLVPLPWWIR